VAVAAPIFVAVRMEKAIGIAAAPQRRLLQGGSCPLWRAPITS
jgi:hypothetical protein